MSLVLLAASGLYEATLYFFGVGIGYFDSIGSLAIAWFSYQEGKESLAKATGQETCCGHCH
jgi:hypothetical protein